LNHELRINKKKPIDKENVIDTLEIARSKFPGSQNSLDALCKRFNINNLIREKHSALIDCHLLKEVYINLLDQKAPKFNFDSIEVTDFKNNYKTTENKNIIRKIIKPSNEELQLHKKYLTLNLKKNFYN